MIEKVLCVVLCCAALTSGVQAEQLYVKNRPFKGVVSRADGKIWVELKPFAEALGWTVVGDEQTGYALYHGTVESCPGAGKVSVAGSQIECRFDGSAQVALEDVAPLLNATVVKNKELQTIDVNVAKKRGQISAGRSSSIGDFPYTLIEFSSPQDQLCKDIQPALAQAEAKYPNVNHVLCNVDNKGALQRYLQYKQVKDASFPEAVLVDSQGAVLFQLRGNHVIAGGLMSELRKKVKAP